MRLASLFSGGKDSCYAMHLAAMQHEICGLITLRSKNKESYMFHTPAIDITKLQTQAMELQQIILNTPGKKEEELEDLKTSIKKAKKMWKIEGITTGALLSVYQATRIQKICDELGLWCFNPLWQMDQLELLNQLIVNRFNIIITGVFAYPLDESWLGRSLDKDMIEELEKMQQKYKINPAGEGGEFETLVLEAPMFKKPLKITHISKHFNNHAGHLEMEASL